MAEVIVAVPTCRRPGGLRTLLTTLEKMDTALDLAVVVADNDPQAQEGRKLVEQLAPDYRWPIKGIVVEQRGIPQVRNALIAEALADPLARYVAMIDDDEWPIPGWIDELVRVQRLTGADVTGGSVFPQFEGEPPKWAAQCRVLASRNDVSGPVDLVNSTANVLITRACLEAVPRPWFDPAFALTGGSDRDTFTRMKRLGRTFAWAQDAAVGESLPSSRVSVKWVLSRAFRIGNSDMRTLLRYRQGLGEVGRELVNIAGAFVTVPFSYVIAGSPGGRVDALCRASRACGKVAALFNSHYREYVTIHGT